MLLISTLKSCNTEWIAQSLWKCFRLAWKKEPISFTAALNPDAVSPGDECIVLRLQGASCLIFSLCGFDALMSKRTDWKSLDVSIFCLLPVLSLSLVFVAASQASYPLHRNILDLWCAHKCLLTTYPSSLRLLGCSSAAKLQSVAVFSPAQLYRRPACLCCSQPSPPPFLSKANFHYRAGWLIQIEKFYQADYWWNPKNRSENSF